jgi:nucleoside-diphosphate-sugar epimerase
VTPTTAVVTGAAGWLGQNLVRALPHERVRALVHHPDEAAAIELANPNIEVVAGDVRDPAVVDRLFDGVAAGATVFHAAGVIHPRRPRDFYDVNVGGTQNVVDRARRAQAQRFVHVSSNSPFGANPTNDHRFTEADAFDPYMGYGKSKHEAELLVQRSHHRGDVAAVIVRPPWFYGPFQPARQTQWLRTVRQGRFPLVGDGTNKRSMVFTGNLVHGLLRAEAAPAEATGRAYWIADAEPYAMADVLDTVRRAFEEEGMAATHRQPRLPRLVGVVAERMDGFLQQMGKYVQPLHVLGELKDTIACDITEARRALGYHPETTLLGGMRASIRWCIERGQAL